MKASSSAQVGVRVDQKPRSVCALTRCPYELRARAGRATPQSSEEALQICGLH